MQLEHILSAAVAAGDVNQIDIDEIPSPDVPAASPSAPTSPPTRPCVASPSPCASPLSISPGLESIINSTSAVHRGKSLMVPPDDKSLDIFPKECSPMSSNNTLQGDLTECDPLSAVDDFSLFNLREDSLVITSQQALAMFENSNDDGNTPFHQRSSICPKDTLKLQKEPAALCPKSIRTGHHHTPQILGSVELRVEEDLDVPAACGEVEIETSTASPEPVIEKFNENIINSSPVVHSLENFEVPNLELEHSSERDDDQDITCEESDNVIDDLPDISVANDLHTKDEMNSLKNLTKKSTSHVSDDLIQDFNVSRTNDAPIVPRSSNSSQLPANIVVVSRQEAFEQASPTQTFDSSVTSSLNENDDGSRQDAEAEPMSQILSQTINEVLNEACGTGMPDESSSLEVFDNIEKIFDMTSPTSFFKNQTETLSYSSDDHESHCAPSSEDTQLQYTALTPVSSAASVNPLFEDNLGSLTGLEPTAGATIDATLDENGQFLVQVIAPGLNMSIPNQFLNKVKPIDMSNNETNSASSHSSADVDEHVPAMENIKCSEGKNSSRAQKKNFERHNVTRKRRISPDALETIYSVSTMKKQCKAVDEKNKKYISSKTNNISAKTDCKKMKMKKKKRKSLEQIIPAGGTTENNLNKYKQPPQFSLYHSHMNVNSYAYPPYNYYPHQMCNYGQPRNFYGPNAPHNLYYKSAFATPIQSNHSNYENCIWSMEEMLNSRTTHPTACKEFHAGFYDCFDSFDDSFNSSRPPAVNDQCDVPIIMSPEEYHSKLQNGGQLPGNMGSAELVQADTDGESLKVQLVYLVYPTKKSSGEGRRSGFHEQDFWQNEHRKDAVHLPCDADFGGDVHPHGLFPQCPGVPVTRHGDDVAIYPSHPPQHYGYGPPQQYMYEREDLQTNPTPAGTTAPSLSARDKTISWLSSGDSSSFTPYKPADAITSPTSHNTSSAKKSDDYRGRPMSTWEFRHVAHFLIEATHDLGIQYEDTDFSQLSKVNGQKLISMGPEHYEKFAPTQGQRIFDYVRRHRNHEVLTDGALDTCTESSPDVSSMRSIETPPVSFCAPTWTTVSDEAYSYYPPADTFPVENSFSNVKNQSSPPSSKVPSPYAPMSVDTSLPTTSTFSDPFQFMEGSCSSDSAAKQESHLVPTSLSTPYSTQSLMNSGSLLPPASVESTTSYHSQMLRPPKSSNGSQQDKSGLNDTIRPSSSMSAATSEIEESSDDDDDDGEGDDEEEEEEEEVEEKVVEEKPPEPPKKRGPGRPPKPESERKKKKKTGRLWEFIRNLLLNPETCPSIVKWEDSETGVFRFVQSEKVAERWGMRKNNKKMNYEKLSRAMRYYYKGKVFEPVLGRRLVYKFGVNAKGWKPNEGNFGE